MDVHASRQREHKSFRVSILSSTPSRETFKASTPTAQDSGRLFISRDNRQKAR